MTRATRLVAMAAPAVALALTLAAAAPSVVRAHSLLQSSDPTAGATLGSAPTIVSLTFGEPPDPRLSSVTVTGATGETVSTAPATASSSDPDTLQVPVGSLVDGVYTVSWRAVSSVDGHVAVGSFAFGVGVAPPARGVAADTDAEGGSPAAIVARLVLYLGLIALLGTGYVATFVDRPGAVRVDVLVRLATGAWLVAAVGTAFTVAVTWEEAGGDIGALVGSSIGVAGIVRVVAMALAALPVVALGRAVEASRRRWLALAGVGAVLAISVDIATGHAASAQSGLIGLAAQWVHAVAASLWIGGLGALLLAVRGSPSAEKAATVRRFSTWAAPWIALVAATGVVRAVQEVGSIDELVGQPYGQLVIAKSVLLLVLASLGATNRWWSVPAAARTLGRLHRIGAAEIGVAAIVVAVAAALVNGVPPVLLAEEAGSGPAPIILTGVDAGTSLKLRLAITPGGAGSDTFDAVTTDGSGAPVAAKAIALRFSLLSRTGIDDSTLPLQAATGATGAFRATGSNLSVDGIWRVTATVSSGGGSVDLPFVLATTLAVQPVDVLPGQGTPTIYAVHLPDGTSAQLYLDPGTAGHDELHATFFDATGTERPIATAALMTGVGAGELLEPRLLEPGHFVAEVDVEAGSLPVDVVGVDAAGAQVHVHAILEVKP